MDPAALDEHPELRDSLVTIQRQRSVRRVLAIVELVFALIAMFALVGLMYSDDPGSRLSTVTQPR